MRYGHARTVSTPACRVRRNLESLFRLFLIVSITPIFSFLSGCAGFANGENQTPTASFQLSPSNLNFGQVVVGKAATQAVSISNTGKTAVKITQITSSNSHFSVPPMITPMLLPVGRTETLTVTVNPTSTGNLTGTLEAQADGASSAGAIRLFATALSSQAQMSVSPASINFGSVSTGSKAISNVLITNSGAVELTISMLGLTGADFALSGLATPKTINPGESVGVALAFSPVAAGGVTGSLSITSSDPASPTITVPIRGTGTVLATGQLSANPGNLSFGSVSTGASANKQIVLTNTGSASVSISSIRGVGLTVSGVTTPTTLNPSQNLTILTSFSPISVGSTTGSITIVSDAEDSSLTIPFTGTGVQAELTMSPTHYNFGTVLTGQTKSQTITIDNPGSATLTITQLNTSGSGYTASGLLTPVTIPPGGKATFNVLFAPTVAGNLNGAISIASNASSSPSIFPLSGAGVAPSLVLSANPPNLGFSSINAGSSSSKTLTISNTGNTGLTISQITTNNANFSVSGMTTPLTLAVGQSAPINVTFKPLATGAVTGQVVISSNQGANTVIPVSGNAVQPALSTAPSTVAFGNVTEGSTASQTVQLTNSGSGTLSITQITVTGSGFSTGSLPIPASLNPGQSTSFNVQFVPEFAGLASGSVVILSNASHSSSLVSLSGTGVASTQSLALSATSLAFGNVNAGSSSTQSVTLTNTGNSKVTVSQIVENGAGFTLSGASTPVTLNPAQSMTFGVIFSPSASGNDTGTVTVAGSATGYPRSIALSGAGVQMVNHSVELNWSPSTSNVVGYNVYRSTVNGAGYSKINPSGLVAAMAYDDASVQGGSTYYYVVTAVDANGDESADSNQATAVIP
jgi:hypothetical protein